MARFIGGLMPFLVQHAAPREQEKLRISRARLDHGCPETEDHDKNVVPVQLPELLRLVREEPVRVETEQPCEGRCPLHVAQGVDAPPRCSARKDRRDPCVRAHRAVA